MFWKKECDLRLQSFSINHIDMDFYVNNVFLSRFTWGVLLSQN